MNMFDKKIYSTRRSELRKKMKDGILLFPGNRESSMNYKANTYHFRQDSSFLYYFGLDYPDFDAICDIDEDKDIVYANDLGIDDIIWMGDQPSVSSRAEKAGVQETRPSDRFRSDVQEAISKGRKVHILPSYRGDQLIHLSDILSVPISQVKDFISIDFVKAVISMREIKDEHEVQQIEHAVDTAWKMHTTFMRMAQPGVWEREIAGTIEGIALAECGPVSFPVILSMDGQILHNHYHGNLLKEGRLIIADAGCESPMHYASDITRTVPVGGKFSQKQQEIYEIVLESNMKAIEMIKPGVTNREVHLKAATVIAEGLKSLGLMKGNIDEAVNKGAHALFFPHGIGHMLGLDVHDMENLGEKHVGYDESVDRSEQFGLAYLRMGKPYKKGFVVTIEPGIYFIPALIDLWRKDNKFSEFINYDKVEAYRSFGGIRIEDDVLLEENGYRVLGKPIPKTVSDIESIMRT
jgi:Xaa-Pro aminopeptidase